MKPAPSILRSIAFAGPAPVVLDPVKGRLIQAPGPARATFQRRTQHVLDYLVTTLRKTW